MSNYNELRLTYQGGVQDTITLNDSTIQYGEYQEQNIIAVEVPEIVEEIGDYAFCDNNDLASIILNEGLVRIGDQAFQHGVYTAVTIPSTVTYIGWNSFNMNDEQGTDHHTFTVTCLATTPPTLVDYEGITFGNPVYLTIYVPGASYLAYKSAWSAYASKIQAIPTFTQADIVSAYVGTEIVEKIYLGDEQIWGELPIPDAQLYCNGEYITGTSVLDPSIIEIDAADTSVTFDVVMNDQNTPWIISDGINVAASGTGTTSNIVVDAYPGVPEWLSQAWTLVYKKEGDPDTAEDWTGVGGVLTFSVAENWIDLRNWINNQSGSLYNKTIGSKIACLHGAAIWTGGTATTAGTFTDMAAQTGSTQSTDTARTSFMIAKEQPYCQFKPTGTTTFSQAVPTSTKEINGVTCDVYDLGVNMYPAYGYSRLSSYVPTGRMFIIDNN